MPKIKWRWIVFLLGLACLKGLAGSHHYCFCLDAEDLFLYPWQQCGIIRETCVSPPWKKKNVKKVSMSTVNQWPLSAAWLWRLRHPSLCSPTNGGLLDPRLRGPVRGTRDGWAHSFGQESQHPFCLVNGSQVVSCMRLCVCVQRAAFSLPGKEMWGDFARSMFQNFICALPKGTRGDRPASTLFRLNKLHLT